MYFNVGSQEAVLSGAVYTRWGREECREGVDLVYEGNRSNDIFKSLNIIKPYDMITFHLNHVVKAPVTPGHVPTLKTPQRSYFY